MRTYPYFRFAPAAVKSAAKHSDWRTFRERLNRTIRFRNRNARSRIAGRFSRWIFENGNLDCLAVRVWKSYQDDDLPIELLRERFLTCHAPMRRFVLEKLPEIPPGTYIRHRDIVEQKSPSDGYSARNVRWTPADMGLATEETAPDGNQTAYVNHIRVPATAFIILLHYNLARRAGTILEVSDIERDTFWRMLGVPEISVARYVLSEAANEGIISYERSGDGPERVTTRYGHRDLVDARFSLD